ncbi:MAG TPA: serine/threonine-protein kinase [Kofleriaceae bacterium]|nr:serine/threonine-protein kinase [Kofleriaceae bacterium]
MDDPTRTGGGDDATLPTTDVSQGSDRPRDLEDHGIDVGARLGRYELTERVGAGGMGVVWAARDPELDRIVAVKILRARAGNADGELRLRREGQTMARLTHANVIRVYDVGVTGGAVFVAMEYVGGGTLHDWLEKKPRSVEEILAVFAHAGRGLAAAHDAGLVHRDFKPSNVLVGDDGRVLVTDFGLARPPSPSSDDARALRDEVSAGGLLRTITRAGGLVGTPAFMAPEQHAGGPVDARADQFAFCVALWRALYKRPPFAGDSLDELSASTNNGKLETPPSGAKVPAHVRAALERGLAAQPASRFPSMRELLAALSDEERRRKRQRLIAAGVVIAALGGAAAVWAIGTRAGDPCASKTDRFAGVWDAGVAKTVRDAFAATKMPFADASYREVARQLDLKRGAWEAMRLDSCEATRVRGEQSDAMMDARARCLEQRLGDLGAFVALLQKADKNLVAQAAQTVAGVGDISACGDIATLARRVPPPDDPVKRGEIDALEKDLAASRALVHTGHYADAAKASDELVARARRTGYAPALAEALAEAGEAANQSDHLAEAEPLLEQAGLAAEAGGDDELRFDVETRLVAVVGYELERLSDGERHAARAEALLTRLGNSPRRRGNLANSRAIELWWNGHYEEARTQAQISVDAFTEADPQGLDVARALHTRAIIEQEVHDLNASVASEEKARALAERVVGPQHPFVADMWNTSGGSLRLLHKYDQAVAHLTRGITILEATSGPDSAAVGASLMNLAIVYLDQDKPEQAIPILERQRAIWEKIYGADHSRVADTDDNLGAAYSKAGRDADAETTLHRAIDIHTKRVGRDSPATASSWKQLGYHEQRMKRWAAAKTAFTEALRAIDASQGTKSPLAVRPLLGLGDVEVALGDRAAAAAAYERALSLAPPDEPDLRKELTDKLAAARKP